jgi:PhnB protein
LSWQLRIFTYTIEFFIPAVLIIQCFGKKQRLASIVLAAPRGSFCDQKKENKNMLRCIPFLLFDGNCAEAMTFYHKCLGGELTLTKLVDTPMKAQFSPEKHKRIINAQLKSGAIEISAADWMASPAFEPRQGNTYAIFVIGEAYNQLKPVFDKLKDGAEKERLQELHDMPFGIYGQFYDRFGVQWIFKGDSGK